MAENQFKETYKLFLNYQQSLHEKNQRKIKIGLKVNIFLPLVFLIISFISNGSKLVFLILWIVSLFGISFYLLYIEYTDFKLQQKMHEFGLVEDNEAEALIGQEVLYGMQKLENVGDLEVFQDIKDLRAGIKEDIEARGEAREEARKEIAKKLTIKKNIDKIDSDVKEKPVKEKTSDIKKESWYVEGKWDVDDWDSENWDDTELAKDDYFEEKQWTEDKDWSPEEKRLLGIEDEEFYDIKMTEGGREKDEERS